jgi:general stress protein 26
MSDKTAAEVEDKLWKAIEHHRVGMLGLTGSRQHFQPMTAFAEPETGTLWFFVSYGNDLIEAARGGGAEVMFTFQTRELYACIGGRLRVDTDPGRIDRFWNPSVAAWHPGGKDDPDLTLLRLDAGEAAVWLVEGGLVKYLFEVAKANASNTAPDVGERRDLNLH